MSSSSENDEKGMQKIRAQTKQRQRRKEGLDSPKRKLRHKKKGKSSDDDSSSDERSTSAKKKGSKADKKKQKDDNKENKRAHKKGNKSSSHNLPFHSGGDWEIRIDPADLDKQSSSSRKPLSAAEQRRYINANFGDGTCGLEQVPIDSDLSSVNERLLAPAGERVEPTGMVFVESLTTGRFRRVGYDKLEEERIEADAQQAKENIDPTEKLEQRMGVVSEVSFTVFLLCQGILAGVAATHAFIIATTSGKDFLALYCPMSNAIRRMFFFGCIISFVGAW